MSTMSKKPVKRRSRTGATGVRSGGIEVFAPRHRKAAWLMITLTFVVLVAIVTERLTPRHDALTYNIDAERVASETHKAEFKYEAPDIQETLKAQEAAMALVPDIYQVDVDKVEAELAALEERIAFLESQNDAVEAVVREALLASKPGDAAADVISAALVEFAAGLVQEPPLADIDEPSALAFWLMPRLDTVPERVFDPESGGGPVTLADRGKPMEWAHLPQLASLSERVLREVLVYGVVGTQTQAVSPEDKKIRVVRRLTAGNLTPVEELSLKQVPSAEQAQQQFLPREIEEAIQDVRSRTTEPVDWNRAHRAIYAMAKPGIVDTLQFDTIETTKARELARARVKPVMREILKGQTIQEEGKLWTEQSKAEARRYYELKQTGQEPYTSVLRTLIGNMIFVALVLFTLVRSLPLACRRGEAFQCLGLALLMIVAATGVARVVSYFDPTGLSVPVTAAAVLMAILVNTRLASITSLIIAFLVSIQYGYNWELLVVGATMSIAGIFSIYRVRRRSDMTSAILKAAAVGLCVVIGLSLTSGALMNEELLRRLTLVALNGLVCLFIVPGLLSPLERLFGITTDIQLLEYSDLNNEVLSRLAIEVPATYAHSLMLGQLAESAADAIGANGLLARVCAYYHDIGKMRRPDYFVENQTGANIHDTLTPRLSARAIASHVTEGAEMARDYHLPKPIIDGILEHHGTCLIGFFYQQACEQQKHGDVRESDFRYPGPRPQSRETAILMICDAVESGIRSIKNPNEERVKEFIDKIIAGRSADRQFDECNLTLRELDIIGDVVAKRMLSNLHTRIAYPDKVIEKKVNNVIPMSGGQET